MEQELVYQGVRYVIGSENGAGRSWAIFPENGPEDGAAGGFARMQGARGSFKQAVHAAREAIDRWLAGDGFAAEDDDADEADDAVPALQPPGP